MTKRRGKGEFKGSEAEVSMLSSKDQRIDQCGWSDESWRVQGDKVGKEVGATYISLEDLRWVRGPWITTEWPKSRTEVTENSERLLLKTATQ